MKSMLLKRATTLAIENFFRQNFVQELQSSLIEFEKTYDNLNPIKLDKMKMKIKTIELNNEFVRHVYERQSEEKKEFIYLKYYKLMTNIAISIKLNIQEGTLKRWKNEFVTEVYDALFKGKFTFEDVLLCLGKIDTIIKNYEDSIIYFDKLKNIDNKTTKHFLLIKINYLKNIKGIVEELFENMTEKEISIIKIKYFSDKVLTDNEVAAECFVSRTLVIAYTKKFKDGLSEKLYEKKTIIN